MGIWEKINQDLKQAMKEKDKFRLEAIRAIKSQILLLKTKKGANNSIDEADILKVIQKMLKQRKESAQLYKDKGREDLAHEELMQAKYIEQYLPQQMSEEELKTELKKIIEELGAQTMREIGKVMAVATKQFAGRADNRKISQIVKQLLT